MNYERVSFTMSKPVVGKMKNQRTKMKTILVIEDNSEILENLTEFLEMEGFKVLAADNGKKGVEIARAIIPDLILCDVLMREMDGHEVLHLLLESAKTHEIPFIFSTSMSEKIDRAESLSLGADDYIVKPFELDDLLKIIEAWLISGSKRHTIATTAN